MQKHLAALKRIKALRKEIETFKAMPAAQGMTHPTFKTWRLAVRSLLREEFGDKHVFTIAFEQQDFAGSKPRELPTRLSLLDPDRFF
jgi:hypothetical protein